MKKLESLKGLTSLCSKSQKTVVGGFTPGPIDLVPCNNQGDCRGVKCSICMHQAMGGVCIPLC